MDESKYNRNVELQCPTCGGSQFEYGEDIDADDAGVRCIGCDRSMTKAELIDANAENINQHVAEIGDDVVRDLQKDLGRIFKRAFRK